MLLFFRRISLSAAVAIMLVVSSMLAPVPASAIVINNGMIVVHNRLRAPLTVKIVNTFGHVMEADTLKPGGTFYANRCCYAAGTTYHVYLYSSGAWDPVRKEMGEDAISQEMAVTPMLCNDHGIPYGFAEYTVASGRAVRVIQEHGCYAGPRQ